MVTTIDNNSTDPILTASEVAAELRCSKSHVYKILNGTVAGLTVLPHLALGRKKVIPRSTFERWKWQNLSGIIPGHSEQNAVDAMHPTKGEAMHAS
jgi:Helix-turn-helix domain